MFCPECGKKIDDESKFCMECGAKMEDYKISKSKEKVSAKEFLDRKKELKCSKCGTQNPLDSKFCEECGNALNSIDKPITSSSNISQSSIGNAKDHKKSDVPKSRPKEDNNKNTGSKALFALCIIGIVFLGVFSAIFYETNTSTDTTDYSSSSDYSSSYDDSSYSSSSDSSNSYSSASAEIPIEVVVHYDGKWQGSIGGLSSSSSYSGYGDRVISFTGTQNSYISATVQKNGGGSGTLTVEIYKNGNLVNSQSTNAAYGIVTLSG